MWISRGHTLNREGSLEVTVAVSSRDESGMNQDSAGREQSWVNPGYLLDDCVLGTREQARKATVSFSKMLGIT